MKPAIPLLALALLGLASCNQRRDGIAPVLGDDATVAEKERFARRIYLDLTGLPPTPAQTEALIRRLDAEGNTAETRGAVAAEIIASPEMAHLSFTEAADAAFSGQTIGVGYYIVCEVARAMDAACGACEEADPCQCDCPQIAGFRAEREALSALADDLAAGGDTSTSDIEKALCKSAPFLYNGTTAEGIATQVFQAFLARPPEGDELDNARFMTFGSFVPGSPSGLLFHRHGGSYDDLLDIVFESEVYRDAMVLRAFQRYLGRRPSSDELRHFSASLDPGKPDMRPLVHALVSSSEYFQP